MSEKKICPKIFANFVNFGFDHFDCVGEKKETMNMNDLVGTWEVPLYDKIHKIQFEHGTTTGRRVLWIDGEVNLNLFFFFLFSVV